MPLRLNRGHEGAELGIEQKAIEQGVPQRCLTMGKCVPIPDRVEDLLSPPSPLHHSEAQQRLQLLEFVLVFPYLKSPDWNEGQQLVTEQRRLFPTCGGKDA